MSPAMWSCPAGEVLQRGEQGVVDEVEQRVAGDRPRRRRPSCASAGAPGAATCSRRRRARAAVSRSSKILRKNIQAICSMRWASP